MIWTTILLCAGSLLTLVLAVPAFRQDAREAEFYALLLFSLLGIGAFWLFQRQGFGLGF